MTHRRLLASALTLAIATALSGCATAPANDTASAAPSESMPETASNPLFAPSPLQWQYPQFDKIKIEHFAPAFDRGMQEETVEFEAIANNPEPATFENTIVAIERTGQTLGRTLAVFSGINSTNTNDAIQKLQAEYAPKFSAHRDAISLNPALFARVKTVYEQRNQLGLDPESLRLVEEYYDDFVRAGANLTPEQKERVKAMNSEMATLSTKFNQNVLAEVNDSAILVDSRDELIGLSDEQIQVLADAAKAKGQEGKYRIALLNTTGQPLLGQLQNRALRERIMKASLARGSRGNQWDNREIVSRVAKLRAERAAIMAIPTMRRSPCRTRPPRRPKPSTRCFRSWPRPPSPTPAWKAPSCRR